MTKLKYLDVSQNNLIRFGIGIPLPELRTVIARENRIVLIYALSAPNLETLNLAKNRVTSNYFEHHMPHYQHLKELVLDDNRVYRIDRLRLPALTKLSAKENLIPPVHQICPGTATCDFARQLID